jgi:hypothetical protein
MQKTISTLIMICLFIKVYAQEFSASVNRNRVAVGEQFQLSFNLNATGNNFRSPSLQDFQVYGGPNQSSSMSWINGSVSQQITYSYYLAAKHEGKITIGSASINVNGKTISSRPITIEVVKGNNQNANAQGNAKNGKSQSNENADLGNNLFIRTVPSKTRVYLGEVLSVTYKLYTRVNILDNALSHMPSFNGFWSEEIKQRASGFHAENIDGLQYQVAEIKKTILVPQQSGKLIVDPIEMEIVTRVRSRNQNNDPFEQFFNMGMFGGYQDVKVKVSSKPVGIEVLNLPSAGKPQGFSGAVGEYSMECSMKPSAQKLKANDAGNVFFSISGKGNLKLVDAPKINVPSDIEIYDPKINDKLSTTEAGISGKRTFDYLFIPRHEGSFTISPPAFSYFDPRKERYITLQTPEFNIKVERGSGGQGKNPVISYYNNNQKTIAQLGNDIAYIKTKTELKNKKKPVYGSGLFWLSCGLPFLMLGGYAGYEKYRSATMKNMAGIRQRRAGRIAVEKLKTAKQLMDKNQPSAFYKEVLTATTGYLADKYRMPLSEMSRDSISEMLIKQGVNKEKSAAFVALIKQCEFAQYAPGIHSSMQKDYADAIAAIENIENT